MSTVHVGTPAEGWEGCKRHFIHFHNFENLPSKKIQLVLSLPFSSFGSEWRLRIYPGGGSGAKEGKVSVYLEHCSDSDITVSFHFVIKDQSGEAVSSFGPSAFRKFTKKETHWGLVNFIDRAVLMDPSRKVLEHGTLSIEVRLKPSEDHHCNNFIPKNAFMSKMSGLFLDEDTSDVLFEVKGQDEAGQQDTVFPAHKLVLDVCADGSLIHSLCDSVCGSGDHNKSSPIQISDISPVIFRKMLGYVYGQNMPAAEWKDHAQDLIGAADKYGLTNLKIEAEAWYVKFLKMKVGDVIETLVYAEKMNCFLLKEAAIDFIVAYLKDIPESKSIIGDILFSVATMNKKSDDAKEKSGDLSNLSINDLRAKLHAKGEDFDGSKETLIAQLK